MPYVITTTLRHGLPGATKSDVSRRAVATLEEARNIIIDATVSGYIGVNGVYDLPEAGGTIGPLPDGTVIEVAPVSP